MATRVVRRPGRAPGRERFVFHHCSSPLWEIDVSALRQMAARWQRQGATELGGYLQRQPGELDRALDAMRVVDANQAALALYDAGTVEELVSPWNMPRDEQSRRVLARIVEAAVAGGAAAPIRCRPRTLRGTPLDALLLMHVPQPGDRFPHVLVEVLPAAVQRDEVARAVIDTIPDQVFAKDREGRFILANRALVEWTGEQSLSGVVGKTDLDLFPPEVASKFQADDRRVMDSGEPDTNIEEEVRSSRGLRRWALTTKVPIRDSAGNVTGIIGVVRDVTDRKALERRLEDERRLMRTVIDALPDCIFMKDRQGRFLLANQALAALMEVQSPEELIGRTDRDFYDAERAAAFEREERAVLQDGKWVVNEPEAWTSREQVRWLAVSKVPLTDQDGRVTGLVGISRDVTRSREAEERNVLLASMVRNSNDAIVGIDLEDRITTWNLGAEKVFGYTAAEMELKPITSLVSPGGEPQIQAARDSLGQGPVRQFDSAVIRKDGSEAFISSTISLIEDSRQRIIGTTLISRDITKQRALQAQIIRAQRLESLATLAAGIAHQFNNINAAVRGYLDVALMETEVPDRVRSWIQEALRGVQRAVEITERLQSFSSVAHAGQEPLDLAAVVPVILPLFTAVAAEQGVDLRTELAAAFVRTNQPTIGFVITSMVNNALHALIERDRREILLRCRPAGAYGVLEVQDTGCGISEEDLPRVFTPFFTTKGEWASPGSAQGRVRGLGLSLSVCQSSVAEQGGWIEVDSREGRGTTFRVWLPSGEAPGPV